MHTAFGALTEALNSQRQQLETYATQQHAASNVMLQHTQTAIALARQHLQEAGSATASCHQAVDHTLDSQSSALSSFDHSFANSMQEEQVVLLATHIPCFQHASSRVCVCVCVFMRCHMLGSLCIGNGLPQAWHHLRSASSHPCMTFVPTVEWLSHQQLLHWEKSATLLS